jgi:hypothetical protein
MRVVNNGSIPRTQENLGKSCSFLLSSMGCQITAINVQPLTLILTVWEAHYLWLSGILNQL